MPSNVELYDYYCRRSGCHPNSLVKKRLESADGNTLEVLDVSTNYLGQRGLIPLLDLVKNTKTIHTLNLSHQDLGTEQVQHLAYCLALHPSMRSVQLCYSGLHDGQVDVLLQLLSMNNGITEMKVDGNHLSATCTRAIKSALQHNEETQQQRRSEETVHASYLAEKSAVASTATNTATVERNFSASLVDSIPTTESGGYVHYATWWKNPQFVIKTSRPTRVTLTLENLRGNTGADQMGVMVLRHDGVHRALEISESAPQTVVAESPVSDQLCTVETYLSQEESYVVMPYTFNPGRSLQFRLTATLLNDFAGQEEGWVTLERLDSRYDWCICSVEDGVWTSANAGGSGRHTTWRQNDMYRLTDKTAPNDSNNTDGNRTAALSVHGNSDGNSTATVYVLLTREADSYHNDSKRIIGVDVVRPDRHNPNAPPLFYTTEVICASQPHAAVPFTLLKFELPVSCFDVYVVPSTGVPGETGTYALTVFSSVAVQLTKSVFPHGWRYRALQGAWDETCCGGCRAECPSWKNNPAWEVAMEETTQPLIACVELRSNVMTHADLHDDASRIPILAVETTEAAGKNTTTPSNTTTVTETKVTMAEEESAEAAQRQIELAVFRERHRSRKLEVGVMATEVTAPAYQVLATSAPTPRATSITICPTLPSMYIVPVLRRAAETAAYTLELFSPSPFVVASSGGTCLANRERQAQLDAYAAENGQRAALLKAAGQQSQAGKNPHDTVALQAVRNEIFKKIAETGLLFTDRDFPRGTSSLFLDPAAPPPLDFPVQTSWKRVSELAEELLKEQRNDRHLRDEESVVREVSPANMLPPCPDGPRHWFASVLQAIAAKPNWLRGIFIQYAREAGFAQFVYFKQDDWVGVTVDDYLLVDNQNELIYGHSSSNSSDDSNKADFFFALAEKAYAKLHRCYEALEPKVTPDQTTLDLLCQGLMDVTGGSTSVTRIRSLTKPEEMPFEVRENLWRQLKRAIDPSLLCSFMLESNVTDTRERAHVGLLPEHLYGVVDARFVEQQRLIKIRLFGAPHNNKRSGFNSKQINGWKGKWSFDSPRWTATLRNVLDYHTEEPNTAWMHFDEVLYYFTHVLVTEVCKANVSVAGSFAETMTHEPEGAALSLRNPQFALTITLPLPPTTGANEVVNADDELEVCLGLHRRDPRLDVTRAKNATAQFRTRLGFAVFSTDDNTRRLAQVSDDQLLRVVQPSLARDQYVTLRLSSDFFRPSTPSATSSPSVTAAPPKQITIMPFREHPHDPDASYTLSASIASSSGCSRNSERGASLRLTHVASNSSTVITGRWGIDGIKAGPPSFPQWRNNPHFFLSAAEATEVTITLRPTGVNTTATVGFTLHRTKRCNSFLTFDPSTVMASAASGVAGAAASTLATVPSSRSSSSSSCVVRLAGMAERRGMPYVLVPYSSEDTGTFEIEVVSNKAVQLKAIDPRLDWHRMRTYVSISAANGNAGGSPKFPSWRFNTQLALTFPVEREGRLFISAKRVRSADPRVKLGLMLLHAERPVAGSYRRRLTYEEATDVVAQSTDMTASSSGAAEVVVDTEVSLPRDCGALLLVVYADQPYKEAEVELSFYAAPTVEVQSVKEWATTLVQEGCWNLGTTAGGSRTNFAGWINNPFYGLTVLRPTTVTLLLVQYPRDHEHPVVKRHGAVKALLPPPLAHPNRCTAIQLSVAKYDASLTEVVSTKPTTQAETWVTVVLSPEQPYLVVPCTVEPQHDGDFKLFAFAEHPIELYIVEKPRLPYV